MIIRHPKLTTEGMDLMLEQAALTVRKLPRAELAKRTGLTPNSVRDLLGKLVREMRTGSALVHRGTAQRQRAVHTAYLEIETSSGTIGE